MFSRASVLALKLIPAANASVEGDSIVYCECVDLSVAVATPKGLVIPVLMNAETMGSLDIEKGIAEFSKKACDSKFTIEDIAGGSFTMFVFSFSPWVRACWTEAVYDSPNGDVFGSLSGGRHFAWLVNIRT